MSDPRQLRMELRIMDGYGNVHGVVCREVPRDAAYMGERVVDDARFMPIQFSAEPFDNSLVQLMKVREFRRGLLLDCARQIGGMLADHLEDKEGWHGVERQERIIHPLPNDDAPAPEPQRELNSLPASAGRQEIK